MGKIDEVFVVDQRVVLFCTIACEETQQILHDGHKHEMQTYI